MTTPGERREDQRQSGGQEPTPFDQQETQFAQIPPPDFTPPPSYPPPPSTYPPAGYTPPSYPPPPQSYPPQQPYQQPYYTGYPNASYAGGYGAPQSRTNGLAIGSLVASVLGLPFSFFCFGIAGSVGAIAGIVMGIVALNQIKQSGEQGRGLAVAGIAVGGVVLAIAVVVGIIFAVAAMNN